MSEGKSSGGGHMGMAVVALFVLLVIGMMLAPERTSAGLSRSLELLTTVLVGWLALGNGAAAQLLGLFFVVFLFYKVVTR